MRVSRRGHGGAPAGRAWPAWTGSNHDMARFSSRWADGDPRKADVALMMLLGLRGTPVLYQGDEIGLCDSPVCTGRPARPARRPLLACLCRARCNAHTDAVAQMLLAEASPSPVPARGSRFRDDECNVEDQRGDPDSTLLLARDLISFRKRTDDLRSR